MQDPDSFVQSTELSRSVPRFGGTARKAILFGWILFCIITLLVGVEFFSRRSRNLRFVGLRHATQPYLEFGEFYERTSDELMLKQEGPERYGYHKSGGFYIQSFDAPVKSIAERADFLFQDRADLANQPQANLSRVFVIGGSVAYGYGVTTRGKRWYVLLEQALTSHLGRTVRAVPAAMAGYVSTQERLVLDLMVLPRRPDVVIIFDGFNDANVPAGYGIRPGDPYNQGAIYQEFYSFWFALKKQLALRSYFCRYFFLRPLQRSLEANRRNILADPRRRSNYAQSVASVYLDNILSMLESCEQKGVRCMVFLQPARALTARRKGIHVELGTEEQLCLLAYDEILSRIRALPPTTPIYDLSGVMDRFEPYELYYDSAHFKDPGHQAVADAMYPAVLQALSQAAYEHAPATAFNPTNGRQAPIHPSK